ncbi:MAG: hypothetical protein GEV06_17330 [Luteitalea sp.]|nr:hypothetical protein [Luteitalea sp.]
MYTAAVFGRSAPPRRVWSAPRHHDGFWEAVPTRSLVTFSTGVFLTFSALGFATDQHTVASGT